MNFLIISFTHKNTDIALREKLALDESKKNEILRLIASSENINECMALSTCNRVEIICFVKEIKNASEHIINALSVISGVASEILELRACFYEKESAIHHIFSVASSLDSLVVGENQIAGQLKEAFKFAHENNYANVNISFLIHWALKTAAKVKSLTGISKNPVSISSVAVAKAKEIYELNADIFSTANALIVGAGQMASLLAKHLAASKVNFTIINRNLSRAKALSDEIGALANFDKFEKMDELINRHKLIFVATGADKPIITDKNIENREFKRYIFDICVPRNVDIKNTSNIDIYAVDDLDEIVKSNIAFRQDEAKAAFGIVNESVKAFFKALGEQNSAPLIRALRAHAKNICEEQLEKAIKHGYLKSSDLNEARKLLHQVFKAFLHRPSVRLKDKNDDEIKMFLEHLFDIKIDKNES